MPVATSAPSLTPQRTALLWLVATVTLVLGQDSDVHTCQADLSWMVNSRGQTPCLLASYLQSQCRPMEVNAIPVGTHYLGPQSPAEANECVCSTVVYNLISACAACQGRRWASFTNWSTNCSGGPHLSWWSPGITFDTSQALRAGTDPLESTTSSLPTSTGSTASQNPSSSDPTTAPITPTNANSNSTSNPNAGAIAGGVVGGIVALVAIGLLILWLVLRKRRARVDKNFVVDTEIKPAYSAPSGSSHQRGESQAPMLDNFSPPMGSSTLPSLYGVRPMSPPSGPPTYYGSGLGPMDMSETGTLPMSPSSAVFTTLPSRRSFESFTQSQPSQFGSLVPTPPRRGVGYTGAAELS
ncbi:hypothetical protein FA13DRAFT_1737195 [Coprinellus micaceus]|uniref:Mid2 domain-containing protein n=1 Tax=Coprinellus micaceus TaxID=71717 RepID=A0A4Y7SXF5_COPMI|nr:hypothetical protein FA13DRAFT_1737195 [Coprinellus micaceus]